MGRKLIILLGPTAVGKTDYSIELALRYDSPIISCDSRQIYKEMTIGTAVPTRDQLSVVKHYFIQNKSIHDYYTAGLYESEALSLIDSLFAQGRETLVMTGGSMFYIDAVCNGIPDVPAADRKLRQELTSKLLSEGPEKLAEQLKELDPDTYSSIDRSNGMRVLRALEVCLGTGKPFSSFKMEMPRKRNFEIEKIGLTRDRDDLYSRIDRRVISMIDNGLINEARSLMEFRNLTALQTVGYKELFDHFDGNMSLDESVALIQQHSRKYAKRQMTWWKRDESIKWIHL